MARPKLLLPFGGGVDRQTGSAVVDPDAFADLRNVHVSRGRMELRMGNLRRALIDWGDDVLGIFSVRAEGISAVVVFDATSRDVRLYFVDSDFNQQFLGTLWTLPEGAASIVVAAEAYNKIIFAHDEEDYDLRQATKVVDCLTGSISDLTSDLDRDDAAETIKFRGVARHLNFLFGWGYGKGSDPDRAEILRYSLPGVPTTFVPEHHFIVGMPGDPIVGGGPVNGFFEIAKGAKTYYLHGSSSLDFGLSKVVDEHFGLLRSRLSITVGTERFRWSTDGPRVSNGGPSTDLEFPLDVDSEAAADDAAPYPEFQYPDDANDAFAYYDSKKGEVVFVFGFWGYVLHIKEPQRRWSYRTYENNLVCAGVVYSGGTARVGAGIGSLPSWSAVAGPALHDVCWSEPLKLWCGVGTDSCYTSPDGLTWTSRVIGSGVFTKVCWGTDRFMAVRQGDKPVFSLDGITWTAATTVPNDAYEWNGVAFMAGSVNLFIAVAGDAAADNIMTSPTGVTWTSRVNPQPASGWEAVAASDTAAVVTGTGAFTLSTANATAWAAHASPSSNPYRRAIYVPAPVDLFVAVTDAGDDRIITSAGGIFTAQTTPDAAAYHALGSNGSDEDLPLIIALDSSSGEADFDNASISSVDGEVWVSRPLPTDSDASWTGLDYSPFLRQWVGVSPNSPVGKNILVGQS